MDILFFVSGVAAGSVVLFIYFKVKVGNINLSIYNDLEKKTVLLEERERIAQQEIARLRNDLVDERLRYSIELNQEQTRSNLAQSELAQLRENLSSQKQRLTEQRQEIDDMHKKLTLQFENIAGKLLEEKSQKFSEQNRTSMDILINPLKEKIADFEKKVESAYDQELRDKISLKEEVKKLFELNSKISEEAHNLTRALKSDSKKQGNWGEFILERILERSGLTEGESFTTQGKNMTLTDKEGGRYQPDVIIHLPENKHIVVDSKVSLLAYEQLINADTEENREHYTKLHLHSMKNHVVDLSNKNYSMLNGINAPEFVLLFVPIESSFSVAVQYDHDLFTYAWDKKVVIVSPSTLLATLRTVASIWKQERQNKNVMEIAKLSGDMYDKLVGFIGDMEGIDKNLRQSRDAFDKAMNKLTSGRGSLTITADKIMKLGAKTSKNIDPRYLEEEQDLLD
ncbi:DNA recombination protein RmuC [Solitalea koreensis]|uniref:DNA recombination protein RmuC n=1 Tax=Solitalea koreensis TaxID=543615 RepID=A0A521C1H3_9SPHI|nr:DNA recombination protein RmuC [Solitalea koreensis]SMO53234.1 DNA recombination protein RmuC [Solitalea koreensis]